MTNKSINKDDIKVRSAVREHYASAAVKTSGCCGSGCGCGTVDKAADPTAKGFYSAEEFNALT
jgi:hypothetical protein